LGTQQKKKEVGGSIWGSKNGKGEKKENEGRTKKCPIL